VCLCVCVAARPHVPELHLKLARNKNARVLQMPVYRDERQPKELTFKTACHA